METRTIYASPSSTLRSSISDTGMLPIHWVESGSLWQRAFLVRIARRRLRESKMLSSSLSSMLPSVCIPWGTALKFGDLLTLPTDILEFSQIAWPNPHMWGQDTPRPLYNGAQGSLDPKEPEDAHAHSPRKLETRAPITSMVSMAPTSHFITTQTPVVSNNAWAAGRAFPLPNSQWHAQSQARNPRWTGPQDRFQEPFTEAAVDPFINDPTWRHRGARSSREDIPMPDYSSSSSSRAISSVTGMSYEHSKPSSMSAPMDQEQYSELIEAMTPTKPPMGTRTPSNTLSTMVVLPTGKATTPATTRKASGQKPGTGRTLGLRERSQASSRDVSGSASSPAEKDSSPTKIGASPSGNVKSRKEGDKEKEKEKDKAQKENESVGSSSTEL